MAQSYTMGWPRFFLSSFMNGGSDGEWVGSGGEEREANLQEAEQKNPVQ